MKRREICVCRAENEQCFMGLITELSEVFTSGIKLKTGQ